MLNLQCTASDAVKWIIGFVGLGGTFDSIKSLSSGIFSNECFKF